MTHRLKEHRQAWSNGNPLASAEHAIAWEDTSALTPALSSMIRIHQRFALEVWHISSQPHPLN